MVGVLGTMPVSCVQAACMLVGTSSHCLTTGAYFFVSLGPSSAVFRLIPALCSGATPGIAKGILWGVQEDPIWLSALNYLSLQAWKDIFKLVWCLCFMYHTWPSSDRLSGVLWGPCRAKLVLRFLKCVFC